MAAADPHRVVRRYNALHADRMVWDRTRQDIADYVLPRKSDIIWRRTPGARKTWFQMDSTAEQAAHRVASSLLVTACSPSQKWFSLKTREKELNGIYEVSVWLEECADRLYLALNQSNFSSAVTEFFLDLVVFGSGLLFIEEREPSKGGQHFGGFNFRDNQFASYVWAEGPLQTVDTVIRRFEMPARNIVAQFEREGTIPPDVMNSAKTKPDFPYPVLHAVYPREDAEPGKMYAKAMPWASCYVLERGPHLLQETGFREFPYAAARWSKVSGETYGRGLGDNAYADIRTLNRLVELDLAAGEKEVDPPLEAVQDMVIGEISLRPSDITFVQQRGSVGKLIEKESGWAVTKERLDYLRGAIREAFFYTELDLPRSPSMTATEVRIRWERMLMLLGSSLPRVQTEGLNPIITRCFSMLLRSNALPPIPDILLEQGANIDIQYEGQLARAQRSQDADAIEAWSMWMGGIAQARPEVWDTIKIDDASRLMAEVRGVPPDVVQDDKVIAQVRATRQQQLMQQHQLDQMAQGGMAAGKTAAGVGAGLKALSEASAVPGADEGEPSPEAAPQQATPA